MARLHQLIIFSLDNQHYALHMSVVARIIRAVEMTALPKAPEIVLGLINVEGQIIPVVDFRRRFRLREREIELSDHLVIADTAKRRLALVVDEVIGTFNFPIEEVTSAKAILPQMEYVEGVGKLNGELILIHDLDKFLTLNEEAALDGAMG